MTNKNDPRLQRKFLRAPLKSECLYVDGEHVFKSRILNISEGGIFLSGLPHIPEKNSLPLAIDLPRLPRLSTLTLDQIKMINAEEFSRSVYKTHGSLMRGFEGLRPVDKVFVNYVGCEFLNPTPDFKKAIVFYIETFTKNIVYLLSLFESLGNRSEQLELLRVVADVLGYDCRMKIPLLRAKVLHDYQSLESL